MIIDEKYISKRMKEDQPFKENLVANEIDIKDIESIKRHMIVTDTKRSVFVEAGAGAGKTTLIVTRVMNQIKNGDVLPEQLVVITFTNKAAEELSTRIRLALVKEKSELRKKMEENEASETEEKQFERVSEALDQVSRMTISTIHSFCYKILKEHAFDAKLRMDTQLFEEDKSVEMKKELFEKWFRNASQLMRDELEEVVGWNYKNYLFSTFLNILELPEDVEVRYDAALANQDCKAFFQAKDAQVHKEMAAFGTDVVEILNKQIGTDYKKFEAIKNFDCISTARNAFRCKVYDVFKKNFDENGVKVFDRSYLAPLKSASNEENFVFKYSKLPAISVAEKKQMNDACKKNVHLETLMGCLDEIQVFVNAKVVKYALEAREYCKQVWNDRDLTNDRLLQCAHRMVHSNPKVCATLQKQYRCFYVDEYQDVDHIQEELVWKLGENPEKPGELLPGVLFLVGDPKQSIYRFRGAEPEIYNRVKAQMSAMEQEYVFDLQYNFRSSDKIIGWVNEAFKGMPNYQAMLYPPVKAKAYGKSPKLLDGVYCYKDNTYQFERNANVNEANDIADMIQFLVKHEFQLAVPTKEDKGKTKTVEYSDFLLLSPYSKNVDTIARVLMNRGIPVNLSTDIYVDECYELKMFLLMFSYLANPYDAMAKIGIAQFMESVIDLDKLVKETDGINGFEISQYLLKHIEYFVPRNQKMTKNEMFTIQTRLEQMVESVISLSYGNARAMAKEYEAYLEKMYERELPLVEGNCVRIMNVHKSKGLEGRIVILMNRNDGVSDRDDKYQLRLDKCKGQYRYEYYANVTLPVIKNAAQKNKSNWGASNYAGYAMNHTYRDQSYKDAKAEGERLAYVTVTRAQNVFIFMKPRNEKAKMAGLDVDKINEGIGISNRSSIEAIINSVKEKTASESEETVDVQAVSYVAPALADFSDILQPTGIRISPSALEYEEKMEREEVLEDESIIVPVNDQAVEDSALLKSARVGTAFDVETRPIGNILGTIMHRMYELVVNALDLNRQMKKEALLEYGLEAIAIAIFENDEDIKLRYEQDANQVRLDIAQYLQKVLARFVNDCVMLDRIRQAKEILTEMDFSYVTSIDEDEQMFDELKPYLEKRNIFRDGLKLHEMKMHIVGTADLVLVNADDSISIIDYKSDSHGQLTKEEFAQHLKKYDGQLLLYKYSMAKIFGVELDQISTELYHMYLDEMKSFS